jgi:hypothetical protein
MTSFHIKFRETWPAVSKVAKQTHGAIRMHDTFYKLTFIFKEGN